MLNRSSLLNAIWRKTLTATVALGLSVCAFNAQAALSNLDETNLTASFQTLSNGWVDGDVERASQILSKAEYTTEDWKLFFNAYFSAHPFNNNLAEYLGYPVYHWLADDNKTKLQSALLQTFPVQIEAMVAMHPSDLGTFLRDNVGPRESLINFHKFNNLVFGKNLVSPTDREAAAAAYAQHMANYPQYWNTQPTIDIAAQPYIAPIRGQIMNNIARSLPLTSARKNTVAQLLKLSGTKLDIWSNYELLVIDNNGLDEKQLSVIYNLLNIIPAGLHKTTSISVNDTLGNSSDNGQSYVSLTEFLGINIFGARVGAMPDNPFASDVAPYYDDLFGGVTAHELTHIIAANSVYEIPSRISRQTDLISRAGTNRMNYLRSNLEDGFFVNNPQEFVASIGTIGFANTERTLELGLVRWKNGYKEPINQFLFFAEIFANGGNQVPFYLWDSTNQIYQRQMVTVQRNSNGYINSLTYNGTAYQFTLDAQGNVTDIPSLSVCKEFTATNSAHVTANRATKKSTSSWFGTKTEYFTIGSSQSMGTSGITSTILNEYPAGYFAIGKCPAPPAPPVVDSISAPTVTKVSEASGNTSFDIKVTGAASDVNGDLQSVSMAWDSVSTSCAGTASFNCVLRATVPTSSLPRTLDNVVYIIASDKVGKLSAAKYLPSVRLDNVATKACFTATNSAHASAARATVKYSSLYYAVGSNTYLGIATTSTSLQETAVGSGQWAKVTACP